VFQNYKTRGLFLWQEMRLQLLTGCREDLSICAINWHTEGNLLGSGALAISGAWLLYFYTTFCGLTLIEPRLFSPSPASLTPSVTHDGLSDR
jgi:hypothetical protein